jgi:hypothetical protein
VFVSCKVFSVFQTGEGMMMTGQNAGFAGPRNVASNAFLRQSPSPSALQSSPAGLGAAPSRYSSVHVLTDYIRCPISDSVPAVSVICGLLQPEKNLKIEEINGS